MLVKGALARMVYLCYRSKPSIGEWCMNLTYLPIALTVWLGGCWWYPVCHNMARLPLTSWDTCCYYGYMYAHNLQQHYVNTIIWKCNIWLLQVGPNTSPFHIVHIMTCYDLVMLQARPSPAMILIKYFKPSKWKWVYSCVGYVFGSGYETVAAVLPGFAINW